MTGSVEPFVAQMGFAAYHRDFGPSAHRKGSAGARPNAHVISKGPNGGVMMMNLADEKDKSELFLAGHGGKVPSGPVCPR